MDSILFVYVPFTACSNNLIIVGVKVLIPLVVFITLEKDEIHGNPPDFCCWSWNQF